MKRTLPWLAIGTSFAFAAAARFWLIEPEGIGSLCDAGGPWWCRLRQAIIASFSRQGLGWISLVAGIAAFVLRRRSIALLAALTGAAGLVFYCYEPAAVGFALAVVVLAGTSARAEANSGTA